MVEKRYAVASPVHQEGDDKYTMEREPINAGRLDRTGSSRPQWSFALTTFRVLHSRGFARWMQNSWMESRSVN
ncbi:hypothetical protein IEQ34_025067 [Dendrobium chrysotoxum]|uniref:Uncharacterized protein n=1 Tax=Dendrobium chrysotoxum TaxID=161865 RepID=A0AAV7FRD0_DENCH|nr:hypothetical protein IEQ34_025067 [Dendrobium chrysotoxum]